jgi:RNA polymerase sigma factor (sigma-70 family)
MSLAADSRPRAGRTIAAVTLPTTTAGLEALQAEVVRIVRGMEDVCGAPAEDLRDAVQEACIAVVRETAAGEQIESLGARLVALTHNKAIDHIRRRTTQQRAAQRAFDREGVRATAPDPVDRTVEELTDAELAAEIERLPPIRRDAVKGRHFQGLSLHELAVRLGTSPAMCKKHALKGLRDLRARLLARYIDFCPRGEALATAGGRRSVDGLDRRVPAISAHLDACPQCQASQRWVETVDRALEGLLVPPGVGIGVEQGEDPERRLDRARALLGALRRAGGGLRDGVAELAGRATPSGRTGEVATAAGASGGVAAAGTVATGGLSATKLAAICASIGVLGGGACYGISSLGASAPRPLRAPEAALAMRAAGKVIRAAAERAAVASAASATPNVVRPAASVASLRHAARNVIATSTSQASTSRVSSPNTSSGSTAASPEQQAAARAGRNPAQKELGIESAASGPPSGGANSGGSSPSSTELGIEPGP